MRLQEISIRGFKCFRALDLPVAGLTVLSGFNASGKSTTRIACAAHRKAVLVDAFSATLRSLGGYAHVAETTVLRPTQDRPLYSLVYGTRSVTGLEVFRDCQIKALREQSQVRGVAKLNAVAAASRQNELFGSLGDMTPDPTIAFLDGEGRAAGEALLNLVPTVPDTIRWVEVWPRVLARAIVTRAQVNALAADLRKSGALIFPDWEARKRVPHDGYRLFRPLAFRQSDYRPNGVTADG